MADSKKYIGIYDTLEDVQDALDNGQLSNPYVAKTMDNGKIDYNSRSPIDYSQYWCTYYPIDAKIWVQTGDSVYSRTEYTKGDGKISKADFPKFYCAGSRNGYGDSSTVVKFKYFQFDSTSATTDFKYAWADCITLTSFPQLDLSSGTSFTEAWSECKALTEFPALDLSSGTNFEAAWKQCYKLAKFSLLNVSNGTNFRDAWRECYALTEFPTVDLSKGTNFYQSWYSCSSLTSFPALDLHNGTDFNYAWGSCSSLTTLGGFGAIKENFSLSDSPKLTVESLMNVINQAATVTGKTMTLGSTNLAKLSDEQKSVATSKGWTLA